MNKTKHYFLNRINKSYIFLVRMSKLRREGTRNQQQEWTGSRLQSCRHERGYLHSCPVLGLWLTDAQRIEMAPPDQKLDKEGTRQAWKTHQSSLEFSRPKDFTSGVYHVFKEDIIFLPQKIKENLLYTNHQVWDACDPLLWGQRNLKTQTWKGHY